MGSGLGMRICSSHHHTLVIITVPLCYYVLKVLFPLALVVITTSRLREAGVPCDHHHMRSPLEVITTCGHYCLPCITVCGHHYLTVHYYVMIITSWVSIFV